MHNKNDLRKKYRALRDNCDKEKEKIIRDLLFKTPQYTNAKVIYSYFPIGSEFDTLPIIKKALSDGKKICLPKCFPCDRSMKFIEVTSLSGDLTSGSYNIPEPRETGITAPPPDLIIVPALSCDLRGNRLGYGGGYYDRFLENCKNTCKLILIHQCLICDSVPVEETDIPANIIITEGGITKVL